MRPRRPPPSLPELVGDDVPPEELERLRGTDELLRSVPPPPEVPSSLTASVLPLGQRPPARQGRRLLAAAVLAAALGAVAAFLFVSSTRGDGFETVDRVALRPTAEAPGARMAIEVGALDEAGNWPLLVTVSGLARLPPGGHYELWLTKGRRLAASCGRFTVADEGETRVYLNAPYRFTDFDRWVVVAEAPGREPVWLLEGPLSAPS